MNSRNFINKTSLLFAVLLMLLMSMAQPLTLRAESTTPIIGKPSIGDPYTPKLGNTGYDVTHYDLALRFDLDANTLDGIATLDITNTLDQMSGFSLDFSELHASGVTFNGAPVQFSQDDAAQKLNVRLARPLQAAEKFKLAITYGGAIKTFDSVYLQFLPIGMFADKNAHRAFAVDEPDGTHSWFPCNDHPRDRATYSYHITVGAGLTAVANGQQQGAPITNADGTRTFHWEMTHEMATYLAVVAIANYEARPLPDGPGIPLAVYAYAQDAANAARAYADTGKIMTLEVARFGAFPYESYGQVLVPQNAVGMEAQTMTVMPDNTVHASPKQLYTFIAHEMSHHWFGDEIALDTWADIWLNEGFASYAEYIVLDDAGNKQDASNLLAQWQQDVTRGSSSDPLDAPKPADMFGVNSYEKGGYVLHMLREKIGDDAFFKTLQTYIARFKDHTAKTADFEAVAQEVSGQDLTAFFAQWIDGKGIPQIDISWTAHDGQVDALVCQRGAGYTLVLPVTLDQLIVAPSTKSDAETIQLMPDKLESTLHFAPGFAVGQWTIDPAHTVLANISVKAFTALPTSCAAPANTPAAHNAI